RADDHVALGSVELPGARFGGVEVDDLALDDRAVGVLPDRRLRVRRLGLILVSEAAAGTRDPGRHALGLAAQGPVADVDRMAAVVAHLAVTEVPEPVPIV